MRWRTWVALFSVVLLVSLFGYVQFTRWKFDSLVAAARAALDDKQAEQALEQLRVAVAQRPESAEARLLSARAEFALKEYAAGIESLARVPLSDAPDVLETFTEGAKALIFHLHQPSRAEAMFRDILRVAPDYAPAIEGLADVLGLSARRWEAIPHLLKVIERGRFRVEHLTLLAAENGAHAAPDLWAQWLKAEPVDPLAHLAWAWHTADTSERAAAIDHLRSAIERRPDLVEAHALLGTLLLKDERLNELTDWQAGLPKSADEFPAIWNVKAQWAQRCGRTDEAVRCYGEAIALNPNLQNANYQIGRLITQSADAEAAEPFLERSLQLQEFSARESVLLHSEHTSLAPIQRVAEQLVVLGRCWEAWGWCRLARQIDPRARWPEAMQAELGQLLAAKPGWTLAASNPVRGFWLDRYPLPQSGVAECNAVPADREKSANGTSIRFEDSSADVGLAFTYFNSGDPSTPGQYMYEFSGGGIAVADYDGDRAPDIYCTQGCRWPHQPGQAEHLDALFRNVGGRSFTPVTQAAAIVEDEYSQGVASGDVNNDGFCDFFVANIGRNRLFINNGDGTFEEQRLPGDPGRWSTSCGIADVNGDTWPDIYVANYVAAPDVFERMCKHKDGVPRMCAPFDFPGSPDEFYLSLGDGTFVEASRQSGMIDENGKGLGVVLADLDGNHTLDIFVANDLVENFLFVNQQSEGSSAPAFSEQAVPLGVAYGVDGRAQGCMGIAAGDANGDQRVDLLVTNFLMEPNAFYMQLAEGFFTDEIHGAGLYNTSMQQLGFGTQFVDADLDGWLDLVVTNGHIDDHRNYGRAFQMPPQFFHNLGEGRYQELSSETVGPFFDGAYLGRGMARCDWNRDGAEDVVISHLEGPVALLTNVSAGRGHYVALHLRGTTSARDAIGAELRISIGDRVLYRQLTSGDGYQASNERVVVFGVGQHAEPVTLDIRWPSGRIEQISDIPVDRHVLLVEGANAAVPYP